jgi:hypothetical protein
LLTFSASFTPLASSALVDRFLASEPFDSVAAALSVLLTFNLVCFFFTLPLAGIATVGASGRLERVRDPMDLQVRRLVGLAMAGMFWDL